MKRVSALFLVFLVACSSVASPAATEVPPTSTEVLPSPTEMPTQTPTPEPSPTPTETPFPYDLPPLPSLNGISVTQMPECNLDMKIYEGEAYIIAATSKADGKRYLIPYYGVGVSNFNEYEECEMYSIKPSSGGFFSFNERRIAVLSVLLNRQFNEEGEYGGIVNMDIPKNFDEDIYRTSMHSENINDLLWVLKSQMRGLIMINSSNKLYFLTSQTKLPVDFFEKLAPDSVFEVFTFGINDSPQGIFDVYNRTNGRAAGKITFEQGTFHHSPGPIDFPVEILVTEEEANNWYEKTN